MANRVSRRCVMCQKTYQGSYGSFVCSPKCRGAYQQSVFKNQQLYLTCERCGEGFWRVDYTRLCAQCKNEIPIASGKIKKITPFDRLTTLLREQGITYAEYQTAQTLKMLKDQEAQKNAK